MLVEILVNKDKGKVMEKAASGQCTFAETLVFLVFDQETGCQVLPGSEYNGKTPLKAAVYVKIQGEIIQGRK